MSSVSWSCTRFCCPASCCCPPALSSALSPSQPTRARVCLPLLALGTPTTRSILSPFSHVRSSRADSMAAVYSKGTKVWSVDFFASLLWSSESARLRRRQAGGTRLSSEGVSRPSTARLPRSPSLLYADSGRPVLRSVHSRQLASSTSVGKRTLAKRLNPFERRRRTTGRTRRACLLSEALPCSPHALADGPGVGGTLSPRSSQLFVPALRRSRALAGFGESPKGGRGGRAE